MELSLEEARERLRAHGQEHVLAHWDRLEDPARKGLLDQIAGLDFESVEIMRDLLATRSAKKEARDIEPGDVLPVTALQDPEAIAEGERVLRAGEAGVILVAGGQGSRLGFDGPKGCYPLAPVSQASLFAIHAHKIVALERAFDTEIPFYIMTSPANDADTRCFFEEHEYFGLRPERVHLFEQGTCPALWGDGRMVLSRPDRIFMSPDGHGGTIAALEASGMFDDMRARSVRVLFYFQVDNPLVEIADPAFLGLHCLREADVSVKVCAKREPEEGLGVVATSDGRSCVVEYTELTCRQKTERREDGDLRFLYGSVAIHVFSRALLEREARTPLPFHLAHKKVAYCDEEGRRIEPESENAYKFERFIFDVLPHAGRVLNVAFRREDEFSPVKRADGPDSPETSRRDISRKFAGWLEACGVAVPKDAAGHPAARIEIDPRTARNAAELRSRLPRGFTLTGDFLLA